MRFRAVKLKLYEFNFAIIKSCGRQSNAVQRSVTRAPNMFPSSTVFSISQSLLKDNAAHHISFLNPYWYLERNLSIYIIIFKSNLELAWSSILKQRELYESNRVSEECRCLKIWDLLSFLICSSILVLKWQQVSPM